MKGKTVVDNNEDRDAKAQRGKRFRLWLGDLEPALKAAANKSGRSMQDEARQRLAQTLLADGLLDTWEPDMAQ